MPHEKNSQQVPVLDSLKPVSLVHILVVIGRNRPMEPTPSNKDHRSAHQFVHKFQYSPGEGTLCLYHRWWFRLLISTLPILVVTINHKTQTRSSGSTNRWDRDKFLGRFHWTIYTDHYLQRLKPHTLWPFPSKNNKPWNLWGTNPTTHTHC